MPRRGDGGAPGAREMVLPARGFLAALEPRFVVFDAPGLFDSMQHAQRVFADPEIRKRLASFGATKGVEPLLIFAHGPLMLLAHRPIRGVAAFNGLTIRVPGGAPMHIEPFTQHGASPASI